MSELQKQNNEQFQDTPVASKQASQSASNNSQPITIKGKSTPSTQPQQSPNDVIANPYVKTIGASGSGKNRKPGIQTTQSLQDVENSARAQYERGNIANDYGTGYYNARYGDEYFDSKWLGINTGSVNNSTADPYYGRGDLNPNVDFEHLRRNSQSTMGALGNTATQFVGKTAINVIGGIAGGFYSLTGGVVESVARGEGISGVFDNTVNRALDSASEWMDENNSVFTSQKARDEQGLLGFNVETMKNLSDGFSFVAGAVISELATAGMATGALGIKALNIGKNLSKLGNIPLATRVAISQAGNKTGNLKAIGNIVKRSQEILEALDDGSRLAKTMTKAERAAFLAEKLGGGLEEGVDMFRRYSNIMQKYSNAGKHIRTTITGTMWEAGLEARHAKDDFINHNLAPALERIDAMNISEEEKQRLKDEKTKEITQLANRAGMLTFGLNTAVLKASNVIQFPSVFGAPSKLNPQRYAKAFKKAVNNPGEFFIKGAIKKGGNLTYRDIGRYFGGIIKNGVTEGTEELTQSLISKGAVNYYNDILGSRTSDRDLFGPTSGWLNSIDEELGTSLDMSGVARFGGAFADALTESLDEKNRKEFLQEGVIGAVMGVMGIPVLKRNKAGKLRPVMAGGVWESTRNVNKFRNDRLQAMTSLNSLKNNLDDITGYNLDRAKIYEKLNRRDDLAVLSGDENAIMENNENKIFNLVSDAKNKGLESYLDESLQEIMDMDTETYAARFGHDPATFTEEDMKAERDRTKASFDRWIKAYDTVYKGLNRDQMNNSRVGDKMFDLLVHSVGMESHWDNQLEIMKKKLQESDFLAKTDMTEEEFEQIASQQAEYKQAIENFRYNMNERVSTEFTKLENELKETQIAFDKGLSVLPTSIQGQVSTLMQELDALKEKGATKEEINKAIEEGKDALHAVLQDANHSINGKPVKQMIVEALNKKAEIYSKLNSLDRNEIEKKIVDKNDDEYQSWKNELDKQLKESNELTRKKIEEQNKLLLDKKEAKDVTLSQMLELMENNERLKNAVRQYSIKSAIGGESLINKFEDKAVDVHNMMEQFELIYAKKMNALRMADSLLGITPGQALSKVAAMEFDTNFQNIMMMANELKQEISDFKLNGQETDAMVINVTYLASALDKLKQDRQDLIDEYKFTVEDLAHVTAEIKMLENLIAETNKLLDISDVRFQSDTDALAQIEKEKERKAQEAVREQEELKKQEEKAKQKGKTKKDTETEEDEEIEEDEEGNPKPNKKNQTAKSLFTVYPTDNAETSLLSKDPRPLGEKVRKGIIKYNQGGVLHKHGGDYYKSEDFVKYLEKAGVTLEQFEEGKRQFEELVESLEDDVQAVFNSMAHDDFSPEMLAYIMHSRISFKIYDAQIDIKDGKQFLDLDDAEELHHMYFYSPVKTDTDSEEFKALKKESETQYNTLQTALQNELLNIQQRKDLDYKEKVRIKNEVSLMYQSKMEAIANKLDQVKQDRNYYTNFRMRIGALLATEEGVKLRIGNFLNGNIQKSISIESGEVAVYNLIGSNEENGLIETMDQLSPVDFAFVNQDNKLVSMATKDVAHINQGSVVSKVYGNSGEVYFLHKTINGQMVPIKLHRNRYGANPELSKAILDVFEQYANDPEENMLNRLKKDLIFPSDHILADFSGLSYKVFFETFFRPKKGNKQHVNEADMNSLTVRANIEKGGDGSVGFGSIRIFSPETFTEHKDALAKFIDNTRIFFDVDTSVKDGKFTQMGKFFIENNLLTHTINTQGNVDKVFKRDENKAIPFQFHILNDTPVKPKAVVTKTKQQVNHLNKLFAGKSKGTLKEFTPYDFSKAIFSKLVKVMASENLEYTDAGIKQAIDIITAIKMNEIAKFLQKYPNLSTLALEEFMEGNFKYKELMEKLKDSTNPLEKYLSFFLAKTISIKNAKNNVAMVRNYVRSASFPAQLKRMFLNDTASTLLSGVELLEDKESGNKFVHNLNTSTAESIQAKKLREEAEKIEDIGVKEDKLNEAKDLAKVGIEKHKRVLRILSHMSKLINNSYDVNFASNKGNPLQQRFRFNGRVGTIGTSIKTPFRQWLAHSVNDNGTIRVEDKRSATAKNLFGFNKYDKFGNKPISFWIVGPKGQLVETTNPEVDFIYDEVTGELVNGVVKTNLTNTRMKDGVAVAANFDYFYMIGTAVPKNILFGEKNSGDANAGKKSLHFVENMMLPGLNSQLEFTEKAEELRLLVEESNQVKDMGAEILELNRTDLDKVVVNISNVISDDMFEKTNVSQSDVNNIKSVFNQRETEILSEILDRFENERYQDIEIASNINRIPVEGQETDTEGQGTGQESEDPDIKDPGEQKDPEGSGETETDNSKKDSKKEGEPTNPPTKPTNKGVEVGTQNGIEVKPVDINVAELMSEIRAVMKGSAKLDLESKVQTILRLVRGEYLAYNKYKQGKGEYNHKMIFDDRNGFITFVSTIITEYRKNNVLQDEASLDRVLEEVVSFYNKTVVPKIDGLTEITIDDVKGHCI